MQPPNHGNHGIQLYGNPSASNSNGRPHEPVGIMFLTSVRDTGGDDLNGGTVKVSEGYRYMLGVVEHTINQTRRGNRLHGILRVAGIVTDDLPRDMRSLPYPVRPESGKPWIHPLNLRTEEGELVAGQDFTHWVPSDFRSLPLDATDERAERKEAFEQRVLELARQHGADVIVSDHYMARIAYMINEAYGRYGRVLNIHPAITRPDHPCRFPGKTPTRDALTQARSGQPTYTGATLHLIDPEIDHGPIIADIAETPVTPTDQPMDLRYRNYQYGKLPLFIAGMRHYIRQIYPHLDQLDFSSLSQLNDVPAVVTV
jgi:hypothetical protein